MIQDEQAIVRPLVEKNANTLIVSCPDDVGTMHADPTKLRQALSLGADGLPQFAFFDQNGKPYSSVIAHRHSRYCRPLRTVEEYSTARELITPFQRVRMSAD